MSPRSLSRPALSAAAIGFVALLLAWVTGGLSASLINPDEGGHYVNALFLGDWIRAGFPAPMAFAQDYYAHFPRLSIGHWPPGWYLIQAPIFAALRPSPLGALILSAFVAGLPAIAILWAFERIGRWRLGVALGLAYLLLPLVLETSRYLLLDQPVTLVIAVAAMAWARASDKPGWRSFLTFAILAAAAPLVKGNGALVALVPAIDIALTGRWRLLRLPQLWVAALVAAALVAPWYWLSFQISSGGFVYKPGLEYAGLSIAANGTAILASIGVGGLALALTGAASAWLKRPEEARIARLAIAVVTATLLFQAIVPAAIEPRYITPLLPWLVVLAGLGLVNLWRAGQAQRGAAVTASVLACIPALLAIGALQPKPDIGADSLAREMAREGGLWLVDARAGGEGAIIAAAAHADAERRTLWVARASQWLSSSDFMGRDYRLTAETPQQARAVLDRIGAGGIVSIAERNRYAYPHSPILYRSVHGREFVGARQSFATGPGAVFVARRWIAIAPNRALLQASRRSVNLGKMTGALR
jgi:hypothetical protein